MSALTGVPDAGSLKVLSSAANTAWESESAHERERKRPATTGRTIGDGRGGLPLLGLELLDADCAVLIDARMVDTSDELNLRDCQHKRE